MFVVVIIAVICWFASVALFLYSLFACVRFLVKFRKNAYLKSNSISNSNKRNSIGLMPWSIVITHCCGLPCAMLAYMLFHIVRDFGFVCDDYWLLMRSTLIASYAIIIVLIFANIFAMLFCAYRSCKS